MSLLLHPCRVLLHHCDLIEQSEEQSGATSFSPHKDNLVLGSESVKYTVVIKLTADMPDEPPSQMQITGQS